MTVKIMGPTLGDWLKGEHDQRFTRETVAVAQSGTERTVATGTVLGATGTGTATSAAAAGNTGDGAMGAITVSAGAQKGVYTLRIIKAAGNAGDFVVTAPDGDIVGYGTVAVAFSAGGLSFTLADGNADFIVGDTFHITVSAYTAKAEEIDFAATDGSQSVYGILIGAVTVPAAADVNGVALTRGPALIRVEDLVWPAGTTAAQKAAVIGELNAKGIKQLQSA